MTNYFFDSSALVKRYVTEPGTPWIRSITTITAVHEIVIAHITPVEVMSAVTRQIRSGTLSTRTGRAIRLLLHRHVKRQYKLVRFSDELVVAAEDLLEHYFLRAYDSVQLASALEINNRLMMAGANPITFVSGDQRLLMAAMAEGLAVDDPYQHP